MTGNRKPKSAAPRRAEPKPGAGAGPGTLKRDISLVITGKSWEDGQKPEVIKLATQGRWYRKAERTILAYRESEQSGLGKTLTTLTLNDDGSVLLLRNGENQMTMAFKEGHRHVTHLQTPFGSLQMGLFTNRVQIRQKAGGGKIHISYAVDFSDAPTTSTHLDVEYSFRS
ncbi:MAG: DUF1934 domain-containing protein [Oscillospiraceae bacterium]|nr:DUF1934 domain-containing protein [Oscillospiraceae bacterium]MDD4368647.1 DUF1934 domain-containing protein [Oscillospiraceae bacterium]